MGKKLEFHKKKALPMDMNEYPPEGVTHFEKMVYSYGFGYDGVVKAIHDGYAKFAMMDHMYKDPREDITIYIPQLVQMAINAEMYKKRLMNSNGPLDANMTEFMGMKVVQGYESDVIVMHIKDSEIKDIKPHRITVKMTKG